MDTMLLTTTGARTFVPDTVPWPFTRTDDGILLVASGDGSDDGPKWYRDVVADPVVHVDEPGRGYDGVARVLACGYRDAAWEKLIAEHPEIVDQQKNADHELPLVEILEIRD